MNGINRRGQKVRCVERIVILNGSDPMRPKALPFVPLLEQVYTVADFIPSLPKQGFEDDGQQPGISLYEMPCLTMEHDGRPVGWPIRSFRPVDERKTDISAMVPAKIREHA